MFLTSRKNIFCFRAAKFVSATYASYAAELGNICLCNIVSATKFPSLARPLSTTSTRHQPSESATNFDHCDDAYSLSIRVQTTLNHIQFVFYHNIKNKERNLCQDLLTTRT